MKLQTDSKCKMLVIRREVLLGSLSGRASGRIPAVSALIKVNLETAIDVLAEVVEDFGGWLAILIISGSHRRHKGQWQP